MNYKDMEYRLHELLVRLQSAVSLLNLDGALLESLEACKDVVENKGYRVAVMGEFKRGKSSLINALLGSAILPADVTPTTATVNRITYGAAPRVVLNYRDGTSREIDIRELSGYVTKWTGGGLREAAGIREAVIHYPTVICQNHVDIIDTPGINEDERMTAISIEAMEQVDAVVVPIHARSPFSEVECDLVCQLIQSGNIHSILFAVTFLDQLDKEDYQYDRYMRFVGDRIRGNTLARLEALGKEAPVLERARRLLDNQAVFGISSTQALKAFVTNDQKLLEESNFERFRDHLLSTITARQLDNALQKAVDIIGKVAERFDGQALARIACYNEAVLECDRQSEAVARYGGGAMERLNGILAEDYPLQEQQIRELNQVKNQAVQCFIASLSQVRSAAEIPAAVNRGEAGAACAIEACLEAAKAKLAEIARREAKSWAGYGRSAIDFCPAGNGEDIASFALEQLAQVKFSWRAPVCPDRGNLAKVNVIDFAVNAVDVSVNELAESLRDALQRIRARIFQRTRDVSAQLAGPVMDGIRAEREKCVLEKSTFQQNFRVLSQDAADCRKQAEALLEAFLEQNSAGF
jgi:hypothetical protein